MATVAPVFALCITPTCAGIPIFAHTLCIRCVKCLDRSRGLWITRNCSFCSQLANKVLCDNDKTAAVALREVRQQMSAYTTIVAHKSLQCDNVPLWDKLLTEHPPPKRTSRVTLFKPTETSQGSVSSMDTSKRPREPTPPAATSSSRARSRSRSPLRQQSSSRASSPARKKNKKEASTSDHGGVSSKTKSSSRSHRGHKSSKKDSHKKSSRHSPKSSASRRTSTPENVSVTASESSETHVPNKDLPIDILTLDMECSGNSIIENVSDSQESVGQSLGVWRFAQPGSDHPRPTHTSHTVADVHRDAATPSSIPDLSWKQGTSASAGSSQEDREEQDEVSIISDREGQGSGSGLDAAHDNTDSPVCSSSNQFVTAQEIDGLLTHALSKFFNQQQENPTMDLGAPLASSAVRPLITSIDLSKIPNPPTLSSAGSSKPATAAFTTSNVRVITDVNPPPLDKAPLRKVAMPLLYGPDESWVLLNSSKPELAQPTLSGELPVPREWFIQGNKSKKLRALDALGNVLDVNIKAIPSYYHQDYFVYASKPALPPASASKLFSDWSKLDGFNDIKALSALTPELDLQTVTDEAANPVLKVGQLGPGPWVDWEVEAQNFATTFTSKSSHQIPQDTHSWFSMPVGSAGGVPSALFAFLAAPKINLCELKDPFTTPTPAHLDREFRLRGKAFRLFSQYIVSQQVAKSLLRSTQAIADADARRSVELSRRLILQSSIQSLGDIRTALLEAVRARQDLRMSLVRKLPDRIANQVVMSPVLTPSLMSPDVWRTVFNMAQAVKHSPAQAKKPAFNFPKPRPPTKAQPGGSKPFLPPKSSQSPLGQYRHRQRGFSGQRGRGQFKPGQSQSSAHTSQPAKRPTPPTPPSKN